MNTQKKMPHEDDGPTDSGEYLSGRCSVKRIKESRTKLQAGSRRLRFLVWGTWFGPAILYALIVFFSPLDILERSRLLSEFCLHTERAAAHWFPAVDLFGHAGSTRFEQVARLSTSYMFWWWWIAALGTFLIFVPAILNHRLRLGYPDKNPTVMLFVAPCMLFLYVWGFYCLPGDWSMANGASTGSRLGYFFLSFVGAVMTSVGMGYWPILLVITIINLFQGGKRNG
ncbi:hypothetical protein PV762_07225 [Mitsuaria sp. CC2]|uniref:hypothetical protein n=1 Tax=Mitsuaria sp. CC2 TaxID=3029186 RepID=UPI003B8B0769